MKRISRRWILCLLWCIPLKCTAQQIYTSRIVDSETEEPLPYAVVKLSSSRSTLTNRDGFFSLKALGDEDSLHISFIGYQKKSLIVRELPEVIRLSPVEKALKELTVLSVTPEWIVDKVRKKLHQEYKRRKREKALYFFRTNMDKAGTRQVVEGFYSALSAVNIRQPFIVSGQTMVNGAMEIGERIKYTDLHNLFSLSPQMYDNSHWQGLLYPLSDLLEARQCYSLSLSSIGNSEDTRMYIINMRYNGLRPKGWNGHVILQGNLYVNAATLRLLRFEGSALGLQQRVDYTSKKSALRITIDYSHERNFTEVSTMLLDGGNDDLSYHCLLFKVDNEMTSHHKNINIEKANLIQSIDNAGYHEALWDKYNIVKRTEEEEQIVKNGLEENKEDMNE